jgi:hypothetical protein
MNRGRIGLLFLVRNPPAASARSKSPPNISRRLRRPANCLSRRDPSQPGVYPRATEWFALSTLASQSPTPASHQPAEPLGAVLFPHANFSVVG